VERSEAPAFSCLSCIYRDSVPLRTSVNGQQVYYCMRFPPFKDSTSLGDRKWHRVEVTEAVYCGEFTDRVTLDGYQDVWDKWLEERSNGTSQSGTS
jgi:hypothetical protein